MGGTPLAAEKTAVAARLVESYGRLPLSFEANQGQTDSQVKFLSRGPGYSLFLTGDEAVLALRKPSSAATSSINQNLAFGKPLLAATTIVEGRRTQAPDPQNLPPTIVRMKLLGANPADQSSALINCPRKSTTWSATTQVDGEPMFLPMHRYSTRKSILALMLSITATNVRSNMTLYLLPARTQMQLLWTSRLNNRNSKFHKDKPKHTPESTIEATLYYPPEAARCDSRSLWRIN